MNTYPTQDFYLTAFLAATGIPIHNFWRDAGLTTFEFERTDKLLELVREYYADEALFSPIQYGNSLKNLKCLIHSTHNGNPNTNNFRPAR